MRFAFDMNGSYVANTGYIMPTESLWLLAVLNSELIEFLLCQITNVPRGGFLKLHTNSTIRLPIVTPETSLQRRLESIAKIGVNGEPVDDEEVNDIVYWQYGLSKEDVALIKSWFERRSLTSQ